MKKNYSFKLLRYTLSILLILSVGNHSYGSKLLSRWVIVHPYDQFHQLLTLQKYSFEEDSFKKLLKIEKYLEHNKNQDALDTIESFEIDEKKDPLLKGILLFRKGYIHLLNHKIGEAHLCLKKSEALLNQENALFWAKIVRSKNFHLSLLKGLNSNYFSYLPELELLASENKLSYLKKLLIREEINVSCLKDTFRNVKEKFHHLLKDFRNDSQVSHLWNLISYSLFLLDQKDSEELDLIMRSFPPLEEESQNRIFLVFMHIIKGLDKLNSYNYTAAEENLLKALQLCSRSEKSVRPIITLILGDLYILNTPKISMEYYRKSYEYSKSTSDTLGKAYAFVGIGQCFFEKGNYKKAVEYFDKAIHFFDQGGLRSQVARCYYLKGESLRMSDHVQEAQILFRKSFQIADLINNKEIQGWAQLGLADVYRITAKVDEALTFYEKALQLFQDIQNKVGIGRALRGWGTLLFRQGEYEKAQEYLLQSLEISSRVLDGETKSKSLINLGRISLAKGHFQKARVLYERALTVFREGNNPWGEVQILTYLGDLERSRNQCPQAKNIYEKALHLSRKIGDRAKEAMSLFGIGVLHFYELEYEKAHHCFHLAQSIYTSIDHQQGVAMCLRERGKVHLKQNQKRPSKETLNQALTLFKSIQDPLGECRVWRTLGDLEATHHAPEKAKVLYKKALDLSRKIHNKRETAKVLKNMGGLASQKGNFQEASKKIFTASQYFEEISDDWNCAQALEALSEVYRRMKKPKEAQNCQEKALQKYSLLNPEPAPLQ